MKDRISQEFCTTHIQKKLGTLIKVPTISFTTLGKITRVISLANLPAALAGNSGNDTAPEVFNTSTNDGINLLYVTIAVFGLACICNLVKSCDKPKHKHHKKVVTPEEKLESGEYKLMETNDAPKSGLFNSKSLPDLHAKKPDGAELPLLVI